MTKPAEPRAPQIPVGPRLEGVLGLAYRARRPVLLEGATGIGKSEVVRKVAEDLGVTQMISIVPKDAEAHAAFQIQLRGAVVPSNTSTAEGMKLGMNMMNLFVKCDLRDDGIDPVVVRGVHVNLTVMRCTNPKFPMRIESGDFPGNANQATIMAMGLDGSDFDTKALHALLASVR